MSMIKVHNDCSRCHRIVTFQVDSFSLSKWMVGREPIQNAMPELTADQREFLISGICGTCFDKMFGEDD